MTLSSYFSACRKKLLENLSEREASEKLSRRETRSANSTRSAKPAKLSRLSERDHELSEREDRHGKTITLPMTRSMLLGFS
jgi:hypothetical protein